MNDKIEQVQKAVNEVAEKVEERSLAMEILVELRANCKRWFNAFVIVVILWALTIAGFLWYINQYDYSTTVEATGIYNAVDHSGNIVTEDVSPEMWSQFERWLADNGESESN